MIRHTRFEKDVIWWAGKPVLFITIWGLAWAYSHTLAAFWPGVVTAEAWVQIGWGLLIGVGAYIPAGMLTIVTQRRAKYWADQRAIGRWTAWLADQWEVDR